jgi:hypothetical protein
VLDAVRRCREKAAKARFVRYKGRQEKSPSTWMTLKDSPVASASSRVPGGKDAGVHLPMAERRFLRRKCSE